MSSASTLIPSIFQKQAAFNQLYTLKHIQKQLSQDLPTSSTVSNRCCKFILNRGIAYLYKSNCDLMRKYYNKFSFPPNSFKVTFFPPLTFFKSQL